MEIVRYGDRSEKRIRIGVRDQDQITPIAVPDLADLWSRPAADLPLLLATADGTGRSVEDVLLLPPVDGQTEVWAAGVTYARSRSARQEESNVAEVYALVYEADRPELFFKSVSWRVVTDGEPVAIRRDSELNVPEAELAVVANAAGEIVGYTICNDMSSRSIEGENPLYLPQAKIYAGSCALGSGIRPAAELADPLALGIDLTVTRNGQTAWRGTTTTGAMYRTPVDLVEWLFREQAFPAGVILSTGTGLVPEMDFSLQPEDIVQITIEGIGALTNRVVLGKESFSWLSRPAADLMTGSAAQGRAGW
jgi:2-dehydro-3-deoxy-D-arabinonate dehydratase